MAAPELVCPGFDDCGAAVWLRLPDWERALAGSANHCYRNQEKKTPTNHVVQLNMEPTGVSVAIRWQPTAD